MRNLSVACTIHAMVRHTSTFLQLAPCMDLSKAKVLDSNPYTATRCMLESWHIQHNQNKLNWERGNLPEVYAALSVN